MDAPVTAYLPVEEESPAPSARVAGKTDAPFLEGGFREGTLSRVCGSPGKPKSRLSERISGTVRGP
jgi:hypothetical protein